MSRSGYSEDYDDQGPPVEFWRAAVRNSIRGKRGQAFLTEMLTALDAMPEKRLIPYQLEEAGEVCAIGAVGRVRGTAMPAIDPEDDWDANYEIAELFSISRALACEIMWLNDEAGPHTETPEQRWQRMRAWVEKQITATAPTEPTGG